MPAATFDAFVGWALLPVQTYATAVVSQREDGARRSEWTSKMPILLNCTSCVRPAAAEPPNASQVREWRQERPSYSLQIDKVEEERQQDSRDQ